MIDITELEKIAFTVKLKITQSDADAINEIKEKILDRIFLIDTDMQTPVNGNAVATPFQNQKSAFREDIPAPSL